MIKKILKIFLIGVGIFILLATIGSTVMSWPKFFDELDEWPSNMVRQCDGDFGNCIVEAGAVTDFEWDLLYIFEDTNRDEDIEKILGIAYSNIEYKYSRKIIFLRNNQIVHQEYNLSNPWEDSPDGSVFFEYNKGNEYAGYIKKNKENAVFEIGKSNEVIGKTYYELSSIVQ